jgi:hypothetical protein
MTNQHRIELPVSLVLNKMQIEIAEVHHPSYQINKDSKMMVLKGCSEVEYHVLLRSTDILENNLPKCIRSLKICRYCLTQGLNQECILRRSSEKGGTSFLYQHVLSRWLDYLNEPKVT